ncbi:helix-turn-helix domain-containing protein [Amycolatopsis sp. MEPSY49]|uniref:helix-turn-helix domain-containing protein n=1 Tax=Amycolatopsis sp. MEPSY49 TaxID=3151600 RepID=UPI003EF71D5E
MEWTAVDALRGLTRKGAPTRGIRGRSPPGGSGGCAPGKHERGERARAFRGHKVSRQYRQQLPTVDKSIYSAEYQRLCALLRELRLGAGLTRVQVAERLEEPQSFVSKYEAGGASKPSAVSPASEASSN